MNSHKPIASNEQKSSMTSGSHPMNPLKKAGLAATGVSPATGGF